MYDIAIEALDTVRLSIAPASTSVAGPALPPPLNAAQVEEMREVLNRYMALLALFRGGTHPYLKPFLKAVLSIQDDVPGENVGP